MVLNKNPSQNLQEKKETTTKDSKEFEERGGLSKRWGRKERKKIWGKKKISV